MTGDYKITRTWREIFRRNIVLLSGESSDSNAERNVFETRISTETKRLSDPVFL
jgi:hypothetical protein